MESGGLGIQSLGAFNINVVYFIQHTGPLKKTIYFLMPPQGLFLAQEGVEKWAPEASNGIHHCKAFNTNFWYSVQHLASVLLQGGNANGI